MPEALFESFWHKVKRALRPEGRVFFIDSLRNDRTSAIDHIPPHEDAETMIRRLADGRRFQIVKRFYELGSLEARLAEMGWRAQLHATPEFFLYGRVSPAS